MEAYAAYRVLMVEDDRGIAQAVQTQGELWNLQVRQVRDLWHVMEEFAEFDPHLVLLDIGLPCFDGYHWCTEIRRVSRVPVIFISSADNMNIIMAMNLGADDFITKPFDQSVLMAKIQALLRRTYDFGASAPVLEHRGALLNTGDNTPAFLTVHLVPGSGCKITVAPKGAGSENMSRLAMLKPADGVEGVKKFVLDTVEQAGANPCPPVVLGIGIGGSFDHCAALAKKALLRPLDTPNADPYYAALEKELLDAINATGFGPQGFGGATTCLGVAIEQKPTHVACLPVAVNISCHVTRRASREV